MQNGRPLQTALARTTNGGIPTAASVAAATTAPMPATPPRVLTRLPHHEVIQVAARASVDPKTVRRYLNGERCHATTAHRIAMGLAKCGLEMYVRRVG